MTTITLPEFIDKRAEIAGEVIRAGEAGPVASRRSGPYRRRNPPFTARRGFVHDRATPRRVAGPAISSGAHFAKLILDYMREHAREAVLTPTRCRSSPKAAHSTRSNTSAPRWGLRGTAARKQKGIVSRAAKAGKLLAGGFRRSIKCSALAYFVVGCRWRSRAGTLTAGDLSGPGHVVEIRLHETRGGCLAFFENMSLSEFYIYLSLLPTHWLAFMSAGPFLLDQLISWFWPSGRMSA